jgi:hypothetical protein
MLVIGYRVAGGLLILVAVGYQLSVVAKGPGFNPVGFFSFFTILSNLLTAAVLLYGATRVSAKPSLAFELLRGAAVVYMTTTFVVVLILLSGADLQVATPWVDFVVHKLMPVVVVLDWLVVPPRRHLPLSRCLLWLAFPVVWLAYSLVRGAITGWYPYPFLDPGRAGGYGSVTVACVAIAVGMVVLMLVVSWAGNRLGRRRARQ